MNIRKKRYPPEPTGAEKDKITIRALYMLAYLGAIDLALIDLEKELTDIGLYKHTLKHQIGRICKIVAMANGEASFGLKRGNKGQRLRQHSEMYEYAYYRAQECILTPPPNRAYSIVKALSRLFIEAYNDVGAKTNHYYLGEAAKILPRLDIPQLEDKNIDCIITKAVQIKRKKI